MGKKQMTNSPNTQGPPPESGVDLSPVTNKEYVGYAAGMAGYQMQNSIMNQYLLTFCTSVLGIMPLAAGTMTFACKFIDALTDIFFGTLGDRTHTRWGSYKPWYVACAVPACIAFMFLFTKPGFIPMGTIAALVWAYFIYLVFGSVFTTVQQTSYGAFTTVVTANNKERSKLVVFRSIGMNISQLGSALLAMPLMLFFGKGDSQSASGYSGMAIVVGLISIGCYLLCGLSVKERVPLNRGRKVPIRDSVKVFKGNRMMVGIIFFNVFQMMSTALWASLMTYYYLYYKQNPGLISTVQLVGTVFGIIASTFILPRMMRAMEKKMVYLVSAICYVIGYGFVFFLGDMDWALYVFMILFSIGQTFAMTSYYSMIPDAVDYGEWKSGVAAPGFVNTVITFIQKATSGFGTFITGAIISAVGFSAELGMAQTEATRQGIRLAFCVAPLAAIILSLLGFFFLRMKPEEMEKIRAELKERRVQKKA